MRARPMKTVVTAGPTRERIDPVRFISNLSTGFMGYEIAKAAKAKGHKVTLISGPTNLVPPKGIDFIPVETARQMSRAVASNLKKSNCLFMASAVSDWRPAETRPAKIKSSFGTRSIKLAKNPDILYEAGREKKGKVLVGFALESKDLARNAEKKLKKKNLDVIVANKIGKNGRAFGDGRTDVLVITGRGDRRWLRRVTKKRVAGYIVDKAERLWRG